MSDKLRVLDIVPGTSVDGPGLRTSIYFAGCAHRCPGCHNRDSWDFDQGRAMAVGEIMDVVRENAFNVTFSGGDPLYQLPPVTDLARAVKEEGLTLWIYTGFLYEQLSEIEGAEEILSIADVLVDGPFVESLRDLSLRFRGSSNQRIIDLKSTRATGRLTLLDTL